MRYPAFRLFLSFAMLFTAVAGDAHAQSKAIAIVLDSSRSMLSPSPERPEDTREEHALEVLETVIAEIQGDRSNVNADVQLVLFGSGFDWRRHQRRTGLRSSADYPEKGPGCHDVRNVVSYGKLSSTQLEAIRTQAKDARPLGLTPIAQTIDKILADFMRFDDFEIKLITDFEAENCLGRALSICGALKNIDELFELKGKLPRVDVFSLTSSKLVDELSACLPAKDAKDPKQTPEAYPVSVRLFYSQPVPGGLQPDPKNFRIEMFDSARTAIATGRNLPDVLAGNYSFVVSNDIVSARSSLTVPDQSTATVEIPPAKVTVIFEDRDGVEQSPSATATLIQSNRRFPIGTLPASGEFAVAGGNWELEVDVAAGTKIVPFTVIDGEKKDLRIELSGLIRRTDGTSPPRTAPTVQEAQAGTGASEAQTEDTDTEEAQASLSGAPSIGSGATPTTGGTTPGATGNAEPSGPRQTLIRVVLSEPSLLRNNRSGETVRLSGPGATSLRLEPGLTRSLRLEPGDYTIAIGLAEPINFGFSVTPGDEPLRVQVSVAPGWFHARSGRQGRFSLLQDGEEVATFDGQLAAHSLPNGNYRMQFMDATGTRSDVKEFSIQSGRVRELSF